MALTLLAIFGYPLLHPPSANANDAGPPQTPAASTPDALLALAEKAGFKNLTICEEKLLKALPIGEYAVCGPNRDDRDPANDPSKADDWPETRQISAKLIRWLCVNKAALGLIDPKGIEIYGAKVPDPLDLDFISVPFEIDIEHSLLSRGLSLLGAEMGALFLMGSRLSNPVGDALNADSAKVTGSIFLRKGFSATGEVVLRAATVGGNLDCEGGVFSNPNGTALTANNADIKGAVFLNNGFSATGEVDFGSATVGSALDCEGGTFSYPNETALSANRADVKGSVFLSNGFSATGEVDFGSATVGSALDCEGGTFSNPNKTALSADGADIKGGVFLRNRFSATGEVVLRGATVGSNLECDGGIFSNPNGTALDADRVEVAGYLFLRNGFSASGEVNLLSATVGSDLDFTKAILAPQTFVEAKSARIAKTLWWTDIRTSASDSVGDKRPRDVTLSLIDATAGSLIDDESSWPKSGQLFLSGFKFDHLEARPSTGAITTRDAASGLKWLRLQNTENGLPTEPYENFAKVLESQGDDSGARLVRIAMEDDLRATLPWYRQIWPSILGVTIGYGYEPWLALWWALGLVVFGYCSFSLGYQAGVIAPTDKDAFAEFRQGRLPVGYQPFNGFVYSLDTFLPIINLGIKDRWMPDPSLTPGATPLGVASKSDSSIETKPLVETWLGNFLATRFPSFVNSPAFFNRWFFKSGRGLRFYYWVHLLLGWVLVTLFAAGFTGIIRR